MAPEEGHAFVSYVREDGVRVDRVQAILEAAGVRVWRDTADLWPGEDWRARIRDAITRNALAFIACFSTAATAREVSGQNEELYLACEQLRRRRPDRPWLIPVRFDDCDVPEFDIGGGRTLGTLQRVDLIGDTWDVGAARLVAGVLRILDRPVPTTPASQALSERMELLQASALDEAVAVAPLLPREGEDDRRGDLHLVARPLAATGELGRRFLGAEHRAELIKKITAATQKLSFAGEWAPRFDDVSGGISDATLDGFSIRSEIPGPDRPELSRWVSRIEVCDDGTLRYFRSGLAHRHTIEALGSEMRFVLRDAAVAQLTARFVVLASTSFVEADYCGPVAVGVAVTGALGAISGEWMAPGPETFPPWSGNVRAVTTDNYRKTIQVSVDEMAADPCEVARQLTTPLLRTVREPGSPDVLRLRT